MTTSFGRYSTLTCSIDIMSRNTSLRSYLRTLRQATLSTWKDGSCCSCMRSITCCSIVEEVRQRKRSMRRSRIRPTARKAVGKQLRFSLVGICFERWGEKGSCIGQVTLFVAKKTCSSRTSGCMRSLQAQLIQLKSHHRQATAKHPS